MGKATPSRGQGKGTENRAVPRPAGDSEWGRISEANRIRREREQTLAAAVTAQRDANATAPTVRNLRRDVAACLRDADKLTAEQYRAAVEILDVFTRLTAEVMPRVGRLDGMPRGARTEDWPARARRAYAERYRPWRDDPSTRAVVRIDENGTVTVADLVFFVAVDNCGIRQVADRIRSDQRTVLRRIQDALYRYAEIADWLDRPAPPLPAKEITAKAAAIRQKIAPDAPQEVASPAVSVDSVADSPAQLWRWPDYAGEEMRAKLEKSAAALVGN